MSRTGFCSENCAACCRFLVLQVNPQYAELEDVKRWVELHGIKLAIRNGACWAYIPTPCSALAGTQCSLYGTAARPKVCDDWPTSQADIDELHRFTEREICTYSFVAEGELE